MHDLFDIMKKSKDVPALIADTGAVVTYGELATKMEAFCWAVANCQAAGTRPCAGDDRAFLRERPLPKRALVFCMCKNEPGAVIGYLGAMAAGCVPLLLAADLKEAQFAAFYETYRPAYIWASEDWVNRHRSKSPKKERENQAQMGEGDLGDIHAGVSLRKSFYEVCGCETEERPDSVEFLQKSIYEASGYGLWATGNALYEMHPDLALLLATSGSTGDPKLVRLSRRNLRANAESIVEYLHLDASERPITTLPMQYTYGLSIINSHLLAGAAILMTTAGYVQGAFWKFFERQGATSFGGVPYTYEILKKIHLFRKTLPSLRSITQAGGKLSVSLQEEVAQWAQNQGVRFFVMYGQTEATARMGFLPPERCLEKPGSMGIAIPGGRFWLSDENGREICIEKEKAYDKFSAVGELVYEGENVSLGYAVCAEDLKRGDERRGVLYTGDLARRDADGFYYIVGRKKRFVKIFGVRVSLDACEQTLSEWYPEAEIACAGSDDCLNIYFAGEAGRRFFEKEGTTASRMSDGIWMAREAGRKHQSQKAEESMADQNTIARELAEYLHLNHKAFHVIFLEQIPKNEAGKVLYTELP